MFGNRQQEQKIEALGKRVAALEALVARLAARNGIGDEELLSLRRQGPAVPEESQRLVAEGRHIEAIKVYREHTGAGLKEAKDAIDAYRDSL